MQCQRVRTLIALWAGEDLDQADEHKVERHLASCPHCREYRQKMDVSTQTLQQSADEIELTTTASLWPSLSERLSPAPQPTTRRSTNPSYNGWAPALALGAACLVVMLFTRGLDNDPEVADSSFINAEQPSEPPLHTQPVQQPIFVPDNDPNHPLNDDRFRLPLNFDAPPEGF